MAVETLDAHLARIRDGDLTGGQAPDLDRLSRLQDRIAVCSEDWEIELRPGGWIYLGEVVALATQMITDLCVPTAQLEQVPVGEPAA
jgi:hypothetical protein